MGAVIGYAMELNITYANIMLHTNNIARKIYCMNFLLEYSECSIKAY